MSPVRSPQTLLRGSASRAWSGPTWAGSGSQRRPSPHAPATSGRLSAGASSVLRNLNFLSSCTFAFVTRKLPRFCNSGISSFKFLFHSDRADCWSGIQGDFRQSQASTEPYGGTGVHTMGLPCGPVLGLCAPKAGGPGSVSGHGARSHG